MKHMDSNKGQPQALVRSTFRDSADNLADDRLRLVDESHLYKTQERAGQMHWLELLLPVTRSGIQPGKPLPELPCFSRQKRASPRAGNRQRQR